MYKINTVALQFIWLNAISYIVGCFLNRLWFFIVTENAVSYLIWMKGLNTKEKKYMCIQMKGLNIKEETNSCVDWIIKILKPHITFEADKILNSYHPYDNGFFLKFIFWTQPPPWR